MYDEDVFIGIILYWETEDYTYIEHFCIYSSMRNRKYGQKALELLREKYKTIILEIDPPIDEISIRRKGFYERVRFKDNSFVHVHPPYHEGKSGHSLFIMSYPNLLSEMEYENFN
ncbi:GNAT family N-acetyltransferase [Clostridium sp. LP20]|uniref:GNAT family N-acetyltransferase n=1 Tax=Clostridium sp. LP20 TaxID=3418665 RepID=UPI003EE79F00